MYKEDLAFNNLPWLICHKTNPTNQPSNLLSWWGLGLSTFHFCFKHIEFFFQSIDLKSMPSYLTLCWNLGYRTTLNLNSSEFNQKIWVKKASLFEWMFGVDRMKTESVRMTAEAIWTQLNCWLRLPKLHQSASVQVDPSLNECLILCLCKFFTSFIKEKWVVKNV